MESHEEYFKLDDNFCRRDTGKWCFIIEKHRIAYKKIKDLQPVIDIIDVFDCLRKEDMSNEVYENSTLSVEVSVKCCKKHKDELFKHKYFNSNKPQKINKILKEGDVVEVLDCCGWKKHLVAK